MCGSCVPGGSVDRTRAGSSAAGPDDGPSTGRRGGFTLVELMLAIVIFGVVVAVGFTELRQFNEASIVDRASRTVASDVTLTRSYAIRRRTEVTMAADESDRSYAIRAGGDTIQVRSFRGSSDLPLTTLDVRTADDAMTFNARGLLVGSGQVDVDVGRLDRRKRVNVTPLGRTNISVAP